MGVLWGHVGGRVIRRLRLLGVFQDGPAAVVSMSPGHVSVDKDRLRQERFRLSMMSLS